MDSVPESENREGFIRAMAGRGWSVNWQDSRKHIVFKNENGEKVRDSNIAKTFNMDHRKGGIDLMNLKDRSCLKEKNESETEQDARRA